MHLFIGSFQNQIIRKLIQKKAEKKYRMFGIIVEH